MVARLQSLPAQNAYERFYGGETSVPACSEYAIFLKSEIERTMTKRKTESNHHLPTALPSDRRILTNFGLSLISRNAFYYP